MDELYCDEVMSELTMDEMSSSMEYMKDDAYSWLTQMSAIIYTYDDHYQQYGINKEVVTELLRRREKLMEYNGMSLKPHSLYWLCKHMIVNNISINHVHTLPIPQTVTNGLVLQYQKIKTVFTYNEIFNVHFKRYNDDVESLLYRIEFANRSFKNFEDYYMTLMNCQSYSICKSYYEECEELNKTFNDYHHVYLNVNLQDVRYHLNSMGLYLNKLQHVINVYNEH